MVTKTYLKPTYLHTYPCDSSERSDSSNSSENIVTIVVVVPVVALVKSKKIFKQNSMNKNGRIVKKMTVLTKGVHIFLIDSIDSYNDKKNQKILRRRQKL